MNNWPLVSVIVPVFNGEEYVSVAIQRLIDQPYRNIEVIVIDDNSTDQSLAEVQKFVADARVRIIELPDNRGVAIARNVALTAATGEFVWFVDVDDIWSDHFLSQMVTAAVTNAADAAICSAEYRFGANLECQEYVAKYENARTVVGAEAVEVVLLGSGALWNKLIARDALGESPFPALRSKSDHAGMLTILPRLRRISLVPETLYTYIQRDGSISNGGVAQPDNFLALLPIADQALQQLESPLRPPALYSRFRSMIVARAIRETWRLAPPSTRTTRRLTAFVLWSDLAMTIFSDHRSFITCSSAKIAPRSARSAFRYLGRARWSPRGIGAK